MTPSRQLAAIMFTDIVGYTALMGKDSAKALELVNHEKSIIWADNFIAVNKNKNWIELDNQQHGSGCGYDNKYIESESILYDYWDESQIINYSDNNFYMQVDFIEPFGQYTYPDGERMYLSTESLSGPFVHELLHRWNVEMNNYLGFSANNTWGGHYDSSPTGSSFNVAVVNGFIHIC